jgi:cytochrome P450
MSRWLKIKLITVIAWVLRHYLRSRFWMGFLRRFPKLAWLPHPGGWIRLSVHHEDAVSLLELNRNYEVPYLEKMIQLRSPFMLGLPDSDAHTRQRCAVHAVLAPVVLSKVGASSRDAAKAVLGNVSRIEIVHGLTDEVLMQTIGVHLGTGQPSREQLDDARMVFRHIFINPFNSPDVVEDAEAGAGRLHGQVGRIVAARLDPGAPVKDDVLGRLIQNMRDKKGRYLESDDELIQQIGGLLVAWAASVSRSVAFIVDALLDQPDALRHAHDVAVAVAAELDAKPENPDTTIEPMWQVLTEALRWQPPVPAIERVCMREGPVEGQTVRREREVWAVLTAVTMDKVRYPDPRAFKLDRTDQDNLTFGYGLHRCLGLPIARAQMSNIAVELLRRNNVRRACRLQLVGPYPERLDVTFEQP